MTTIEFKKLLERLADNWNSGNALEAANCFTEEATYIEPPNKQFINGQDELYKYFGGEDASSGRMKMMWHNIFFDEKTQKGAGEYTFEMSNQNHGVVIIEIENNKIKHWREYQWTGSLNYSEFISTKNKDFEYSGKDL